MSPRRLINIYGAGKNGEFRRTLLRYRREPVTRASRYGSDRAIRRAAGAGETDSLRRRSDRDDALDGGGGWPSVGKGRAAEGDRRAGSRLLHEHPLAQGTGHRGASRRVALVLVASSRVPGPLRREGGAGERRGSGRILRDQAAPLATRRLGIRSKRAVALAGRAGGQVRGARAPLPGKYGTAATALVRLPGGAPFRRVLVEPAGPAARARAVYAGFHTGSLDEDVAESVTTGGHHKNMVSPSLLGTDHVLRMHPLIELLGGDETELQRRFFQGDAFLVRRLRDLRRFVVADVRVESSDQHQRLPHQLRDALAVRLDADRAVVVEAPAPVGEQPHRLQEVVDDERLEDVQLEVPHGAADVDGDVVAEHLGTEHRHRLALRRVHLSGHDGAAGLVLRDLQLAEPAAGPRR